MGGGGDMVTCPICGKSVRTAEADEHVDSCLASPQLAFDSLDTPVTEETELVKRNKKVVSFSSDTKAEETKSVAVASPVATVSVSSPSATSSNSNSSANPSFGFYGDQLNEYNYLAMLEQRKKQEEADRLLAQRLQEELERETQSALSRTAVAATSPLVVTSTSSSSRASAPTIRASDYIDQEELEKEARDRILALVLQAEEQDSREAAAKAAKEREKRDKEVAEQLQRIQQEEERKRLQRDKEIAEELARKQREAERLREESKKFDSAVELIRDEVVALEEEKKKLAEEVEKLRKKTEKIDLSVGEIRYPDTWDMSYESDCSLVDVARGTNEWKRIQKAFAQTCNKYISRIQRNQNKKLYKWYWLRKEEMKRENYGFANEGWAFHGSRSNAYNTIVNEGFDHRLANLNGALGAGIYFSDQASYSLNFASNKFLSSLHRSAFPSFLTRNLPPQQTLVLSHRQGRSWTWIFWFEKTSHQV
eukprot:TRINITY_DN1688_c0_g1_i2.p1 TRINITY_DN1688_c0_g1~~TRINITY_DN1688_c0_g1_i2.p1  ORF type:complete len:479 (+),score=146.42 TRINITY_DN1688_c0_g1_i2:199-1635(+)